MNFFLKMMLKKQLKNIPDKDIDMLIAIVEKNPEFFKKIAGEIQEKVNKGMSQEDAAKEVMTSYQSELGELMRR